MNMSVQMGLDCEHCGDHRLELVPARFHYSDGCYTVLTISEQKCGCEAEKAAEEAVRRARVALSVRAALRDPPPKSLDTHMFMHALKCQGDCHGADDEPTCAGDWGSELSADQRRKR